MTKRAEAFMTANDESPVVEGWANGPPRFGGGYKLRDGRRFDLSLEDCRSLAPNSYPRWDIPSFEELL